MSFIIVQGLIDAINETLKSLAVRVEDFLPAADIEAMFGSAKPGETNLPESKPTRFCFEPWYNCFIRADNEVRPCCTYETEQKIASPEKLVETYNSAPMVELRRSLLTGDLKPRCKICPHAGMATVGKLRNALRQKEYVELSQPDFR